VVGSARVIIEEEKEALANRTWNSMEVGKVFKGTVKSLTDFGAFVDIGGVDDLSIFQNFHGQESNIRLKY